MTKPQETHFHIHWSGRDELDWECFATVEEAKVNAVNWVRPGETYTIVQSDENCSRCKELSDSRRR